MPPNTIPNHDNGDYHCEDYDDNDGNCDDDGDGLIVMMIDGGDDCDNGLIVMMMIVMWLL